MTSKFDLPMVTTADRYLDLAKRQTAKEIKASRDRLIGQVTPETFEARGIPAELMEELDPRVGQIVNVDAVPRGFKRLWGWREGRRVLVRKVYEDGFEGEILSVTRSDAWRQDGS